MTIPTATLKKLLVPVYILGCGEIIMRVIAGVSVVPDIDLLVYAKELTRPSAVAGLTVEHVPGASANLMGHTIALNDQGHRSPPLAQPKPEGERRIYFMGTSITLGWGVGADQTFAAIVQKLLAENNSRPHDRTYAAVNAGVANYNVFDEAALYRRDRDLVRPDAVVMQYFPRDAEPNQGHRDSALLKYSYLAAFVYRRLGGIFQPEPADDSDRVLRLHRDDSATWRRATATTAEIAEETKKAGGVFAVVLMPDLRGRAAAETTDAVYRMVKRTLAEIGIDVIDPGPAVRRQLGDDPRSGWVHPTDPHPNAAVHRIIGREIYRFLAKQKGIL